jgi:uncharacterized protein YndB with AHSA1/START domain
MPAIDIHASHDMRASREALWGVLTDLNRLPEWLAFANEVADVQGDAATEGSTYTVKPKASYEPETHWRIAQVEPQRRQVHVSEMPMFSGVSSTIELVGAEGNGDTVRAQVHWHGEPKTFVARVMRPMFQKRIQQNWDRSLAALDALAAG